MWQVYAEACCYYSPIVLNYIYILFYRGRICTFIQLNKRKALTGVGHCVCWAQLLFLGVVQLNPDGKTMSCYEL